MLDAGDIASWDSPKEEVKFSTLRAELLNAGFDESLAKEMAPRNAFSRACKLLTETRVIDKVEEDGTEIKFQLTAKTLVGTEFEYSKECDLYLNKDTGRVRGTDVDLAQHAENLVVHHRSVRCSADITRLIQKIFESHKGDLIPIRKQGGVYFVPHTHRDLLLRIQALMAALGGRVNTFNINASDVGTQVSVAEQMTDHLLGLIEEFRVSCKSVTAETSQSVIDRRVQSASDIRMKLESYQSLLSGYSDRISQEIATAENELIQSISATCAA